MIPYGQKRIWARIGLVGAAAALPILTGCQPQSIVARVNGKPITERDFNDKVQHVQSGTFAQAQPNMDAGGLTMQNMIQTLVIDECAAEPSLKAEPNEEAVAAFSKQYLKHNPDIEAKIKMGGLTAAELDRNLKSEMEMVAIGTDGARPDDKELQEAYDTLKAQGKLDFPATYTMKFLVAPVKEKAAELLAKIKQTGNFAEAATQLGYSPEQASQASHGNTISADKLPPSVRKVLDTTGPGQFTTEPIEIPVPPNPNNPSAPAVLYFIAQLISSSPASTPTAAEIHETLLQTALQTKFPQWQLHAASRIGEYTEKANIEIMMDRYKPLLTDVILPMAKRNASLGSSASMQGGMAPPGAAPGGSAPPSSSAAPSSGGAGAAPKSGTKP